jgi:hypothetical protein
MNTRRLLLRLLWGTRPLTTERLLVLVLFGTLLCGLFVWGVMGVIDHHWRFAQDSAIREAVLRHEIRDLCNHQRRADERVFYVETSFAGSPQEEWDLLERLDQQTPAGAVWPRNSSRQDDKGYNLAVGRLEWLDGSRVLVHGTCSRVRGVESKRLYLVQWGENGWEIGKVHFGHFADEAVSTE